MNTKIHQVYTLSNGEIVPSVTTVIGLLNKPQLIEWAWKMGINGQDIHRIKDKTAEAGTLAHQMILDFLKLQKTDTSGYSKDIIDLAENSFLSFLEWQKYKIIEPILVEASLVSEKYKYGGTLDFYGRLDGILTLVDWKTGSGIYDTYVYQLSAYRNLLIENGYTNPERVMVVRINRDANEQFEELIKKNTDIEFEIFKRLLEVYHLQKILELSSLEG
jgi:hypothetical protein